LGNGSILRRKLCVKGFWHEMWCLFGGPFQRGFVEFPGYGYVVNFNRRHKHHGHLFQNRYKLIIGHEQIHFGELGVIFFLLKEFVDFIKLRWGSCGRAVGGRRLWRPGGGVANCGSAFWSFGERGGEVSWGNEFCVPRVISSQQMRPHLRSHYARSRRLRIKHVLHDVPSSS
jgi:hypothetical protein